jgi:hypothetical protein
MTEPGQLSPEVAKQWLGDLGIDFYICDHCAGLHLTGLDAMEDQQECRIFVEEWGLLFSTEFQIRPTMLLPLIASLGQLNGNYPTLKLFLDVVDDAVPQLVSGATQLTGAGLTQPQFELFVTTCIEMTAGVFSDLQDMGCLIENSEPGGSGEHSLH